MQREDYYAEDRRVLGTWGGLAAQRLTLKGDITRDPFARLCENLHPGTGSKLTPRTRDDRTVGYDINFHAPKGVSVVHALTEDERIVEVFQDAVHQTMLEIESNTHTRVRLPGPDGKPRSEDRRTGNLVWGEFVHRKGRPVKGMPDPQLHIHAFTINCTFDEMEQRWKAGQFRHVVRDQPYFEAAFHARFALGMQELGYAIEKRGKHWDLASIDEELIRSFSRRTAQIEAKAAKDGITDPEEKGNLGARTRSGKDKSLSEEQVLADWKARLTPEQQEWIRGVSERAALSVPIQQARGAITPEQAVTHALEHTLERKSVESEKRVIAEALRHAVGQVTPQPVEQVLRMRLEILSKTLEGNDVLITTRAIHAKEQAALKFAVEGKGTCVPLGAGHGGRDGDKYAIGSAAAEKGIELNLQQRAAAEQILSSRDRVQILRGGAGTGKTELLNEVARGIDHGGHQVFACAVTAKASRSVLRKVGFTQAETLQTMLKDQSWHERLRGQVLWIDEAGMMGTRDMRRVCELAEKTGARIILSGDSKQQPPVQRGDALKLLESQAGIRAAEVTEIVRQKGMYKDAVAAMERGELTKSVQLFDEMKAIREIKGENRIETLADRYCELAKGNKTAMVVAPTHEEGRQVTEAIRERLKDNGRIDASQARTFERLKDCQWTNAEKADPRNYEKGMVVQFDQHVARGQKGRTLRAGQRSVVVGTGDKLITIRDAAGTLHPLPCDRPEHFGVYEAKPIELAPGDKIRFTKNDRTIDQRHRLNNGTEYEIRGFTENGHIKLSNGWEVRKQHLHTNHAYCVTPHVAQGSSAHSVLGSFSAESLQASTMEGMYVALSRGKERAEAFVEKRPSFIKAIGRMHKERSATELLGDDPGIAQTRVERQQEHAREVARLKAAEKTRHQQRTYLRKLGNAGKSITQPRGLNPNKGRDRGPGRGRERER